MMLSLSWVCSFRTLNLWVLSLRMSTLTEYRGKRSWYELIKRVRSGSFVSCVARRFYSSLLVVIMSVSDSRIFRAYPREGCDLYPLYLGGHTLHGYSVSLTLDLFQFNLDNLFASLNIADRGFPRLDIVIRKCGLNLSNFYRCSERLYSSYTLAFEHICKWFGLYSQHTSSFREARGS